LIKDRSYTKKLKEKSHKSERIRKTRFVY